jgi:type II secretory ATPase GspE/PulE/Tfp pilus assembly ATPase PilB-like protein
MKVEAFLVASTVNMIIAQRLVRRICTNCIIKYTPEPQVLKALENALGSSIRVESFYKGQGCGECGHVGYKGRIGIYEIMEINDEIRNLISKNAQARDIESAAVKNGMVKLLEDGINKAAAGITTIEEALRASRE